MRVGMHHTIDLPIAIVSIAFSAHEVLRVHRVDTSRFGVVAARIEDGCRVARATGRCERSGGEATTLERIRVERETNKSGVHVASHLEHIANRIESPGATAPPARQLVPGPGIRPDTLDALMAKKGKKTKKAKPTDGTQLIASYRRAYRDYEILDTYEAGMVLTGSEVKSLREGNAQIAEGYARVRQGEMWIDGVHIPPYTNAIGFGAHDPDRERKLLLNRAEIDKLDTRTAQGGLTIVPLRLYWKDGRAKMELGLAKGRTKGDKRQNLAERDADREMETAFNRANKYGERS
jgi:SsrA-binding protein